MTEGVISRTGITATSVTELEANKKSDTVYFTFGRFQPPTIGHEKLINEVIAHSKGERIITIIEKGVKKQIPSPIGDYYIVPSGTQTEPGRQPSTKLTKKTLTFDPLKNAENPEFKSPMNHKFKFELMTKMFPHVNFIKVGSGITGTIPGVIGALKSVYDKIFIVLGSDRAEDESMKKLIERCGVKGDETKTIKIIPVMRDTQSNSLSVKAMSGTKIRTIALSLNPGRPDIKNVKKIQKSLASSNKLNDKNVKNTINNIRAGVGYNEIQWGYFPIGNNDGNTEQVNTEIPNNTDEPECENVENSKACKKRKAENNIYCPLPKKNPESTESGGSKRKATKKDTTFINRLLKKLNL